MRYLRNLKGYNQGEAAKIAGISRSAYQAYEEGRAMPRVQNLPAICRMLNYDDVITMVTVDLTKEPNPVRPKVSLSLNEAVLTAVKILENSLKSQR